MKILKIVVFSILGLILVGALGLYIFIKTFDVNKYLPTITQQISQVAKRKVQISHADLDLNLFKGLSLKLKDVSLGEASQDLRLAVGLVKLHLELLPLLHKEIRVVDVIVVSPKISVIQNSSIQNKNETISSVASPQEGVTQAPAVSEPVQKDKIDLPVVKVKLISVEHASLSFEDQNPKMPIKVIIEDIQARINNFSLSDAFDFVIDINLWSKKETNIHMTGGCNLDLNRLGADVTSFQIKTDLSQWDWNKLKTVTPAFKNIPMWPQEIKGNIVVNAPTVNVSSKGLEGLSIDITLNEGYLKFKELLNAVDHINIQANADLNNLLVKNFHAQVGTGEIDLKAQVKSLLAVPKYDFQLQTKALKIQDLLDETAWPAQLLGLIAVDFTGTGEGFEPELMMNNLKGNGRIALTGAKIEKFNLFKTILDKLSFIPGLSNQIESNLSEKVKAKLSSETTVLDKVQSNINVLNKVVSINDAQVESQLFSVAAKGTVDFNLVTSIAVDAYLAPDVSEDLVKSVRQLQGMLDGQNRLYIPGKVSGKVPAIQYRPHVDYITRKVAVAEGVNQLEKVLDKNPEVKNILNAVLGGGKESQSEMPQSNTSDPQTTQEESSKKLINNVLNNILR